MKFACTLSASLPAYNKTGCIGYMATEFLHNKGNHVRFTKLLFRRHMLIRLCINVLAICRSCQGERPFQSYTVDVPQLKIWGDSSIAKLLKSPH